MKVVSRLAAMLGLAVALGLFAAPANAWCGWRCRGMVPVPVPRLYAGPSRAYPVYGYSPVYWRRDCWYDAFGRRFCSW